jgi:ABC-type polysaccharide/polyol phosphate transport system ATPase subunit
MSFAVRVSDVSKIFRVDSNRDKSLKSLLAKLSTGSLPKSSIEERVVLRNVSFTIKQNEFVGIMGRNGAGKSTLLKIIAGIYRPTSGTVEVNGIVAPLLELGAGFADELSGRENIYLNAAIMGFGRKAINARVNEIIAFSEIGEWIDRPVKRYSSGMLMRLGFSVAVFMEAPILIFDEVLAVGDIGFQRKCLDKIMTLHRSGRSIILVTHSPEDVRKFCSRCILIDHHGVTFDGDAKIGSAKYTEVFEPPKPIILPG